MSKYETLLALHNYAVVDLNIIGEEDWHGELPLQDIVPKGMESDTERMPKLLLLEEDAPYMAWLARNIEAASKGRGEYLFSCLLDAPDTSPDEMMAHLQRHLVFDSRQGKGMLRFYDGQVFPHLQWMLFAPTLKALFGPVKAWTVRLLHGWFSATPPEGDDARAYWALHEDERAQVNRIHQINLALNKWQRQQARPWKDLGEFHLMSRRIKELLLKAQNEARIQGATEQISFALRMIEAHSQTNPAWQP